MVKKSFTLKEFEQAFPEQSGLIRECGDFVYGLNFDPHRDHVWMPIQLQYYCEQLVDQEGNPCLVSEFYGIEFPSIMKSLADEPYYEAEAQDAEWRKARLFLGKKISDSQFRISDCYTAATHVLLWLPADADDFYWMTELGITRNGSVMWENPDGSKCIMRELEHPEQNVDVMEELIYAENIRDYMENEA